MELTDTIDTLDQLEALYRRPGVGAAGKVLQAINPGMAAFIDRCTFLVLATAAPDGTLDASPRGGPAGFVRRLDDRHVAIPDLNGNNRLDSYRNVVVGGTAGLLLIVPGHEETLRINGPATLTTDPALLSGFTAELRPPKLALVVETAEIYGHCAKAFRRGAMWQPDHWPADAPDLAAMYAAHWQLDEQSIRDDLSSAYSAELACD